MLSGPRATVTKARKLRRTTTWPEIILWRRLRQRPEGFKFRRQHPAGAYVLDFFCSEARLAIEVDGIAHDMGDRPRRDEARDAFLRAEGIEVLRIPATDVLKSAEDVAESLVRYCAGKSPPSDA